MPDWPTRPLSEILVQHEPPPARFEPSADVDFAGVRWYGEGLFIRETRKGRDVAGRAYPLKAGTFVYSRLFAWKQSFAVTPDDFDGVMVSNEFLQFGVDPDLALPEYLVLYLASPLPAAELLERSDGATALSRNRLEKDELLAIEILLPPVPVQRVIVRTVSAVNGYIRALDHEASALTEMLRATRQSLIGNAPQVPLMTLCTIESKTVDPKLDEYADLPHLGVAAIEKGTGRLGEYSTARDDGVISAKYRFGPRDVVYAKIRPELRKAAFPGFEGLCSADAYPLTPKEGIEPELLLEALLENSFTNQMTALSPRLKMPKVNRKQLFTGTVRVPPTPEERDRVVRVLTSIRAQVAAVVDEVRRIRVARAALIETMLTGTTQVLAALQDAYGADVGVEPIEANPDGALRTNITPPSSASVRGSV